MRHALASGLLLPLAVLVGASCRDVISPDPIALVPSLCELLAQCEGKAEWDCPSAVRDPFEGLPVSARTAAYARFLEADCLTDCRSARQCRDLLPLCTAPGGGCSEDSGCCGYTQGVAECRGTGEGVCCTPDGAPCKDDSDCCDSGCNSGHCGDFTCELVDEDCKTHFDCCTKRCDFETSLCALKDCSIVGAPCEVASDCCNLAASCSPNEEGQSVCQLASCDDGCNPFVPDNCCVSGDLGFCFLLANDDTVCGDPLCPPAGAECGGDDDCRCFGEEASLVCDDGGFPHCAECRGAGATCDPFSEVPGCCAGMCDEATSTCMP